MADLPPIGLPPEPPVTPSSPTVWVRLLDFIEHPLLLWAAAIVGGLVAFFVYPVLVVCGICVLLAFHRSKVVHGCPIKQQLFWYALLFVVTTSSLFAVGVAIKHNIPQLATLADIRSMMTSIANKNLPAPIAKEQIPNSPVLPQKSLHPPTKAEGDEKHPPPFPTEMGARIIITKLEASRESKCSLDDTKPKSQRDLEERQTNPLELEFRKDINAKRGFLIIHYANAGTLPAVGVWKVSAWSDATPKYPPEIDVVEETMIYTKVYGDKYPDQWNTLVELQPGTSECFSTGRYVPIDEVQAGTSGFWLYVVFKYKDRLMAPKEIGVTEFQAYFINRFDEYHIYRNRTLLWGTDNLSPPPMK